MTIQQAIKRYNLSPVDDATSALKRRELNVDNILYMNITSKKVSYIVEDIQGIWLYTDEKSGLFGSSRQSKKIKLSSK